MILVLTYHKVLRAAEEHVEFYAIREEQLESHIDLLRKNTFSILSPTDLLEFQTPPGRVCVLSFDDGTVDHFEVVKPLLERKNCRGLFFVPTSKVDQPGRLTSEQVCQLNNAGHTVGSHSHEHLRLDRLPEEDVRVQLELAQQKLGSLLGKPPLFMAPPGGFFTPLIRRVAMESGLRVIRTMRWGYNRRPDLSALECIPINHFLTESDFCHILKGRNMQVVYRAKQVAKRIMPGRIYETMRGFVFGLTGRN
jgi:peptidoglycan/xylan/chitin deacetylase (PgdA/CDA1 family)